jgi:hypothetical protein
LTAKEYCKMAKVFIPAVGLLLIHYPRHLIAIRTAIDIILLASYK